MEQKQLATQEMIQILKAVANLRNSVAHKQIIGGMTTYASYGNRHIFDDDYVTKYFNDPDSHISGVDENTLTQLMTDITRATNLLSQLPHAVLNDRP